MAREDEQEADAVNILIVEDDMRLAQALEHILKESGYAVDAVNDGASGLAYAETGRYDAVILDVMLPKMDGFSVVSELRRRNINTAVMLLTARDAVPDKITGLDSGADDYMTKPFSPAELLAHIRALLRRQGEVVFETIKAGDTVLDLENRSIECGSKTIGLSRREFDLSRVLFSNRGMTVPKETLLEKVWGADSFAEDNNVEAYISFLRKKLRYIGSTTRIETIRSVGYRLVADEGRAPC